MTDREIHPEIEVPGTPQQVWDAIATGPGITSWFMPAQFDERPGAEIVFDHGEELTSTGERIKASAGSVVTLSGTVQRTEAGIVSVLLDEPAPGLGLIGAGGAGDVVFAVVRAHLFGNGTAAIAARDEPAWQAWLAEQIKGSAGAR